MQNAFENVDNETFDSTWPPNYGGLIKCNLFPSAHFQDMCHFTLRFLYLIFPISQEELT